MSVTFFRFIFTFKPCHSTELKPNKYIFDIQFSVNFQELNKGQQLNNVTNNSNNLIKHQNPLTIYSSPTVIRKY